MRFLALMVALAAVVPCWGQQAAPSCKVYFKVIQSDPNIPGGHMERLSTKQKKWLRDKAPKKYPGVCHNPAKATYAIVWSQEQYPEIASGSTTSAAIYVSVLKIGAEGKLEEPPLFFDKDHTRFGNLSATASALEQGVKFLSSLAK